MRLQDKETLNIAKAVKSVIDEGTITISIDDSKENDLSKSAKSAGLKVKIQHGAGDGYGGGDDLATFTGPDAKIVKYFLNHLDIGSKNLRDLKKQVGRK